MSDRQAFTGLRILDFTQVLAGPMATAQLAQLGADVIKIEQPGSGDMARNLLSKHNDGVAPAFISCNLGKRSLTLDLKHAEARQIIHKLIQTSDALVENFVPGNMQRLGFDYDTVCAIKPDIVYASISGFGQSGPKAALPAFDGAIQAASGMMASSGHPDTGPVRTGYFAVDMSTALNAAFAISAALFRRHVTGEGQRIDVAMMDTAMLMQGPQVSTYLMQGTEPGLVGNTSPTKQPTANVFGTADGYIQVVALSDAQAERLFKLLDLQDLFNAYPTAGARIKHIPEIDAALRPIFATKTTDAWLQALAEVSVPGAPIQGLARALEDPQFEHRLSIADVPKPSAEHGETGTARVFSAGHMSEPAPPTVQRAAPLLGQHTEEILTELGYTPEQISHLKDQAAI